MSASRTIVNGPGHQHSQISEELNDLANLLTFSVHGDYSHRKNIGSGGTCDSVSVGCLSGNDEEVAVKWVNVKKRHEETAIKLRYIRREVETIKKLRHPNVVKYYGVLVQGTDPVRYRCGIVMEYCADGTLTEAAQQWHRTTKCPIFLLNQTIRFTVPLLQGLEYLHSQNIIHGDVKGDNLVLISTPNGTILKIADFGSMIELSGGLLSVTNQSEVLGTVRYMAPELFLISDDDEVENNGIGVGSSIDVYSTGCVVLLLLTGLDPQYYKTENDNKMLLKEDVPIIYNLGTGQTKPEISEDLQENFPDLCHILRTHLLSHSQNRSTAADLLRHPIFHQ